MPNVTVAGAGGATVTLSFDSAANALLAKSLAGAITVGVGNGSIVPASSKNGLPPPVPGGTTGEWVQQTNGATFLPNDYAAIVSTAKKATIFGTGEDTRDYVYVDDVVEAQVRASEAPTGEMCVIGTGVETSTRRIFDLLAQNCAYERAPVMGPERAGDIRRIALDSAKAREVWGWTPQVSLEDGIARTVEIFRVEST